MCLHDFNIADESIIYIALPPYLEDNNVRLTSSTFSNNVGVCMFLSRCRLGLTGNVLFINNTADNGGALYLDETSKVWLYGGVANITFVDNSAVSRGGAIFVELNYGCSSDYTTFTSQNDNNNNTMVSFVNSKQLYDTNSLYFSVSKYCSINTNYSEWNSLMYMPYQFHYYQVINGMLFEIPYNYNYTQLTVPNFPVMTSPHQLKLYKLDDDIQFLDYISGKILGNPVKFYGIVLDYFDKPAEITEFHVRCLDNYALINNLLLFDNVSPLNLVLVGNEITNSTNVTLLFYSEINHYFQQIKVTLTIELVPCYYHPAYTYSTTSRGCVCYHHDVVECYDDYNEIKRGYWFGSVNGKATTSLCPREYCTFVHRKKTRAGYFKLPPNGVDLQCKQHRSGPACGGCSPGYTLAYDSPDCISKGSCSTGVTVLVIVLTILYWIVSVGVVFSLMYFKFQLTSGYLYGLIYYYSMVAILLNNNPYISSGAAQFINILSGIAQLNPQFLGKLCLLRGISGIDQLFIHYSHAVAVSSLLCGFVVRSCKMFQASG